MCGLKFSSCYSITDNSLAMKDIFKGQALHSLEHKKATDHAGKKVVVIGSCTSGKSILIYHANPH